MLLKKQKEKRKNAIEACEGAKQTSSYIK